ncbi:uncharacterized protein BJ171DRAFT_586762 [Polychytrium aggregatum]|uniref:uncharacterized protein n=1 Tax=Polychytrium aggregatum TaxID=110093 RepID=UPI0022FE2B6D|nr:uncharacterized protein BJ171DRAFT_586762 [Polychytrium aggregatum]KAI9193634.1 hypothetical protein BJ171DRAFT_586762 [Polychytrium aggregatum]
MSYTGLAVLSSDCTTTLFQSPVAFSMTIDTCNQDLIFSSGSGSSLVLNLNGGSGTFLGWPLSSQGLQVTTCSDYEILSFTFGNGSSAVALSLPGSTAKCGLKLSTGAIVGIAVGAAAVIGIAAGLFLLIQRKKLTLRGVVQPSKPPSKTGYQQQVDQPQMSQPPMYQQPVAQQQPMAQQPAYQQPVYQQPVYQQPVYQQPVFQQPMSQQPI